ncbi:Ribokinase-like protein [Pavlovales sp. CCMP2436]|nr:Ribokinase-like protein [Pavlovales sp. CCMP2436]
MRREIRERVLSIQSHVVHGYVGNKAAVFPLQVLGIEVDAINSVQFSNHTGYPRFTGDRLTGERLEELISGLESNGLLGGYSHILTGYIGAASFLRAVLRLVRRVRELRPDATFVCDPVLGDKTRGDTHGKLYVPEELVEIYKNEVIPLASVLTPNHFEAELLTGRNISNCSDAFDACGHLHAQGVRTVVITSADLAAGAGAEQCITLLASQQKEGQEPTRFKIEIPLLPGSYTGTGDLTAALLLAWMHKLGDANLVEAVEKTIASVQAVLSRTHDEAGPGKELRLVQSVADITTPVVILHATPVANN